MAVARVAEVELAPARSSGAPPRKNVSGGCSAGRGRGEAISIQRARPSLRQAWGEADGECAARVRAQPDAAAVEVEDGSPSRTKKLDSNEWTCVST